MKKQLWDAILKPINADNNLSRKIDFDKDILETDNVKRILPYQYPIYNTIL